MNAPSNANTSGLAPCPFCGGNPFDRGFRRWGRLECGSCGAQGPAGSKADATSGWNRRVTAASAQARIAELERALKPFAAMAEAGDQRPKDDAVWAGQDGLRITYGDFRAARAALQQEG